MRNENDGMSLVIEAEPLAPEPRAWLSERCELVRCPQDDHACFEKHLPRAEGLIVRSYTRVDGALLSGAPNLKVVARAGVGLDNIDLKACRDRGVPVVYTPEANADAVCELVWACVFDCIRPRLFLDRPLARTHWERTRQELVAPRGLAGLTLGVLGMGRVGSRVAGVGRALGMRVIYHDLCPITDGQDEAVPGSVGLGELLDRSDVLSVHVDGRPENRSLLGPAELERLRSDVILLNSSRGFVIDPVALADAAIARPGMHAVLDVHEPEPFGEQYPLLDIPNVHLLPHLGAATADAKRNMSWVVRDVWRVLQGQAPRYPAPPADTPIVTERVHQPDESGV